MENDLSVFESSLRQIEGILAGLDADTVRLRADIVEREAEIGRVAKQRIGWLRLSAETKSTLDIALTQEEAAAVAQRGVVTEPERASVIPKNAFSGMGPAEGALKYLRLLKRSQTHPALVKALIKGKVMTEAKNPDISFRTAMARHPEWFVWIKEKGKLGRWELTEWQNRDSSSVEGSIGGAASPKLALVANAGLPG